MRGESAWGSLGVRWAGTGSDRDGEGGGLDVTQTLEGEVRELIRRSGLDPQRDEPAVRRLVKEAVSDYDERSLHGGLPVLADLDATSKALWDSVVGYGPLQRQRPVEWWGLGDGMAS